MKDKESVGLQFRVVEAFVEDVGKGLVRLDKDDLMRLHAVPGDVLMITGRRSTVARSAQVPPTHCGQQLILMDGTTRVNAEIGIDEWATVRKVPFKPADS
ncbi:MAG TPA: AAA family ATPase, partial [Candidatus Methylomirabilis sp.]|nr:AAA family ATPase [Candidatus Methylomirabilis sp.]